MYFPLCVPARAAANAENLKKPDGPRKLYVGNLHPNINEIMLKAVFEPFGMVRMCVHRRQQLNVTFLPLDCVTELSLLRASIAALVGVFTRYCPSDGVCTSHHV